MANEFVSILEKVGKDFELVLSDAVKYLPLASTMAALIFPPAVAPLAAATTVADLLQNTVTLAEQKYAAAGVQTGTGTQKLATVLTVAQATVRAELADPTVASALAKAGITVNATYISNLASAVVAILNVQSAPAATTSSTAVAA